MLSLGWMLREYTEIKYYHGTTQTGLPTGIYIPLGQEMHVAYTGYDNVFDFARLIRELMERKQVGIVDTKCGEWYRENR